MKQKEDTPIMPTQRRKKIMKSFTRSSTAARRRQEIGVKGGEQYE